MSGFHVGVGEGWVSCGRILTPDEATALRLRGYQVDATRRFTRRPGDGAFEPRPVPEVHPLFPDQARK